MVSSPESDFAGPAPARSTRLAEPAARPSLGDIVAERLRQAILTSELSPGQHLTEGQISESLEVSRSPVHNALLILEQEGLVALSRHRGATVVQPTFTDFHEVYSLRSVIEGLALRLAVQRRDESDLLALQQSLADLRAGMKHKITKPVAAQLDMRFHDGIYRAAHHERLYRSWSGIRMQVQWFLLLRPVAGQDWREGMVRSHSRILKLIKAGDGAGAVSAAGEHVRHGYHQISGALISQPPAQETAPGGWPRAEPHLLR